MASSAAAELELSQEVRPIDVAIEIYVADQVRRALVTNASVFQPVVNIGDVQLRVRIQVTARIKSVGLDGRRLAGPWSETL
jgi:hypothetical protein